MKASDLKPGQFFEFVDFPKRHQALASPHSSRLYYIDKHFNLTWCAMDLEVNADVPQCWGDEPNPIASDASPFGGMRGRIATVDPPKLQLREGASPEVRYGLYDDLPQRVLVMCKARNWSLHWTARGAYLHLEASELIEALRGKRGDPLSEAADVLLVLMSITESNGINWASVVRKCNETVERLESAPQYKGEERETKNVC